MVLFTNVVHVYGPWFIEIKPNHKWFPNGQNRFAGSHSKLDSNDILHCVCFNKYKLLSNSSANKNSQLILSLEPRAELLYWGLCEISYTTKGISLFRQGDMALNLPFCHNCYNLEIKPTAQWLERLNVNAKVAKSLVRSQHLSDTVES